MHKHLAVITTTLLIASTTALAAPCAYDVEAVISNTNGKDFKNLPVFVEINALFGAGIDFRKLNKDGFHVFNEKGQEVSFMVRPMGPIFSMGNDELIFIIPKLGKDDKLRYRFVNTARVTGRQVKLDIDKILNNPNNQIPNPGFESGAEGWTGGKVVADVKHSGSKALLIETTGKTSAKLNKELQFSKEGHFYFSAWAKCDNIARSGYHWPSAGGRLTLVNKPLQGGISKIQDTRDWYCYKQREKGDDPDPSGWKVPAVTGRTIGEYEGRRARRKGQKSLIFKNNYKSGLQISLSQSNLPYIDKNKPARIWLDELMLFDQPMIVFDYDSAMTKAGLTGDFVYTRPVTIGNASRGPRPTPWEKVEAIEDDTARGDRKVVLLGLDLPNGGKGIAIANCELEGPSLLTPSEIEYQVIRRHGFKWADWEWWAHDYRGPMDYEHPCQIQFFIAYHIPRDAKPGVYRGTITLKANGQTVGAIPVALDVANFPLKILTERFIGPIYNSGMGRDGGGKMPANNNAFYRYMRRSNFTYVMMFAPWLPFKGRGAEVDLKKLVQKMTFMRDQGGLTAGVGLYWDCTLDRFGKGGIWGRCKGNKEVYRNEVKKADKALADAGLGRLVYMIWDEPTSINANFGILKDTGAITTCDAMGWSFFNCLDYITHTSCDDPPYEMGPGVYEYCKKRGVKYGICGTSWKPLTSRYQVGFMMASSGMDYWHQWHILNFYSQCEHCSKFVRNRSALNMGEGMIDLRYHDTLVDAIAYAQKTSKGKAQAAAAKKYLDTVLDFCSGDLEGNVSFYNGTPSSWGDDRFYDHWRNDMRKHIIAILSRTGPLPVE